MEKKTAMQKSSPSARRAGAGGQDEHRSRTYPKKVGTYRNNAGIGSFYEKKPKASSRGSSKNLKKDSSRWQTLPANDSKRTGKEQNGAVSESEPAFEFDEELALFRDEKVTSSLLNFQYASSSHHKCGPYMKYRQLSQYSRPAVYNKESYLQANCQFVVKEDGDYSLHTVDPDKLVDWDMIEQICLCSHDIPSCPICLDTPRIARITRCGHVYCWSCIIHYLKLGEKQWRKCPICYEAIITSDLKSVITTPAHKYKAGETIEMQLMQRKKGSMLPKPLSAQTVSPSIEWKGDLGSIIRTVHAKLLKASPKIVLDKIVSLELKELEEQLKEAKSEASGEEIFIEMAIEILKERVTELTKNMQAGEKKVQKNDATNLNDQSPKVANTKQIMDILREQIAVTSVDEPAFSDDEESNEIVQGKANQCEDQPRSDKDHTVTAQSEANDVATRKASVSPEYYYYYQAKDGQNIFLQPVNVRCLVHEYGSLQSCPEFITAQIIHIESYSMTQELRKRFRYLSHLPLSCEFSFCELLIRPPVLSRETLTKFANEFYERKMARQRKKREERKLERKIERSRMIDNFGRMLDFEAEATTVDLQSLEDFPSQIGSGSSNGAATSPPVGSAGSWGASSFAKALQNSTQAPVQRREEYRPRTAEVETVSNIGNPANEFLGEDYIPVPSFATAFSNAVSSAMELHEAGRSSTNQKSKGKNKKGKKLLFTTSNGPKYT